MFLTHLIYVQFLSALYIIGSVFYPGYKIVKGHDDDGDDV